MQYGQGYLWRCILLDILHAEEIVSEFCCVMRFGDVWCFGMSLISEPVRSSRCLVEKVRHCWPRAGSRTNRRVADSILSLIRSNDGNPEQACKRQETLTRFSAHYWSATDLEQRWTILGQFARSTSELDACSQCDINCVARR